MDAVYLESGASYATRQIALGIPQEVGKARTQSIGVHTEPAPVNYRINPNLTDNKHVPLMIQTPVLCATAIIMVKGGETWTGEHSWGSLWGRTH